MVNNEWYCATPEEELNSTICCKCRGMLTNGVLHYNNATPYTEAVTAEMIGNHTAVSPTPAYSPELTPSDYYIFQPLEYVTGIPICK